MTTSWMSAVLVLAVALPTVAPAAVPPMTLANPRLRVELGADGSLSVADRASGRTWRQVVAGGFRVEAVTPPTLVTDAAGTQRVRMTLQLPGVGAAPGYQRTNACCTLEVRWPVNPKGTNESRETTNRHLPFVVSLDSLVPVLDVLESDLGPCCAGEAVLDKKIADRW